MKKAILASIAGILLAYLCISFYLLEMNPVKWNGWHRALLIGILLIEAYAVISYEFIVGFKKD